MEHDQPHTAADTTQTQDLDGPDEHAAMPAAPYEDEGLPYDELADEETMPTRPRRKLLTPLTAGLAALLLGAVGFWLGVKVQKEHGSSTAGATVAGFTARRATSGKTTSAGGFAPPGAASAGAGGGETTGEVAYIKGDTLYVTDGEENTVKVATTSATSVSHTVTTKSISAIHPGDTITVQGSKNTGGAITATSVTLSTASASTTTTKPATSSTGTTTLFGEG